MPSQVATWVASPRIRNVWAMAASALAGFGLTFLVVTQIERYVSARHVTTQTKIIAGTDEADRMVERNMSPPEIPVRSPNQLPTPPEADVWYADGGPQAAPRAGNAASRGALLLHPVVRGSGSGIP
ncbi:MAG: hypothetical protein JO022_15810 [Acidobacteriaceae bacterium]|nr:hypothetical protein [Acidobacteriaceae bacterium]